MGPFKSIGERAESVARVALRSRESMKSIKIGLGRIYNSDQISLPANYPGMIIRIEIQDIEVRFYVGSSLRHVVLDHAITPVCANEDAEFVDSRQPRIDSQLPRGSFPANCYTEVVATSFIEIPDELANSFDARDPNSRSIVLARAAECRRDLTSAINMVSGYIGLHLQEALVNFPICDQLYAYRSNGNSYAVESTLSVRIVESFPLNRSGVQLSAIASKIPPLRNDLNWRKSAGVLAWLLRAWSSEDPVQTFVSLFIPLECVIPKPDPSLSAKWTSQREELMSLLSSADSKESTKPLQGFLNSLQPPAPSLRARFASWAQSAQLENWQRDILDFDRFAKLRNALVHAGRQDFGRIGAVTNDDLMMLKSIASRYVCLAIFGQPSMNLLSGFGSSAGHFAQAPEGRTPRIP